MKFSSARQALMYLLESNPDLKNNAVNVQTRALTNEEAIGNPDRKDFPLITGKEVLKQAEIEGYVGQAFTADPIPFVGTVEDVLELPDIRPGNEAITVAVLNALSLKLGLVDHTIHCRNNEPEECGHHVSQYIMEKHGPCKVGIIGLQPAIVEHVVNLFGRDLVHVTDLNPDNIGKVKYGIEIWDGAKDTKRLADWADIILSTGTVTANNTFNEVTRAIENKPCYYYGTTIAGMAALNGLNRICPMSR